MTPMNEPFVAQPHEPAAGSLRRNPWLLALVAGGTAGLIVLGLGGRYAMRLSAIASGRAPDWTFEGTLTVVLLGTGIGAAGALIRAAAARWLPARVPEWPRTALFALACLLLALRGVSPFTTQTLALFMPVVALYAIGVELAWRRWYAPRRDVPAREHSTAPHAA